MPNPISNEPVVIAALAPIIGWFVARYMPGLHLDAGQSTAVAGAIVIVLAPFVRQLVRPVAKDKSAEPVPPAAPK